MDDLLISEVLDRLDRDDGMTDARESLVLGALEGRLGEVIDGAAFERPEPGAAGQEPVARTRLSRVGGRHGVPRHRPNLHVASPFQVRA